MGNIPKPFCPVSSKKLSNSKLSRGELKSRCRSQPNLMFRNFKLTETVAEYTFHDSIRVKVFDFWFHFMEKIGSSTIISIIYRDTKANMTHIALFFDRTDRIGGIFGLK